MPVSLANNRASVRLLAPTTSDHCSSGLFAAGLLHQRLAHHAQSFVVRHRQMQRLRIERAYLIQNECLDMSHASVSVIIKRGVHRLKHQFAQQPGHQK
jgi:hypothetical protein